MPTLGCAGPLREVRYPETERLEVCLVDCLYECPPTSARELDTPIRIGVVARALAE